MALEIEDLVNGGVGGDEPLGLALQLEALHFSPASSDREMTVFDPVVVAQSPLLVPALALQHLERGAARSQSVGHDPLGNEVLVLEQFFQQFQGSRLVAALLDEHVEDLALAVDGPPHVHAPAADPHRHFIKVPSAVGLGAGAAMVS